ncbi:MAG TPA: DUF6297 family protein [Trebonia sp.]|nr:DUF6297 family protein [Trebonia sp.]
MTAGTTALVPGVAPRLATVRKFTRRQRQGRWLDWYAAGFGVLLACIYLGNFLVQPLRRLSSGARGLPVGQGETGLALVIAAAAGLLLLAQSLGPLTLSPADASWLLMSPLDRRGVLRSSLRALTGAAALAGALLGVLALAMAGPYIRAFTPARLGDWLLLAAVAGGALAVAMVDVLLLLQPHQERVRPAARVLLRVIALAAVAFAVAGEHWAGLPRAVARGLAPVSLAATSTVTVAAVVLAAVAGLAAWARLRSFPADVLWADSAHAGRVRLAAAFLNVQLLGWIAEDNYWRRRVLASRPWPKRKPWQARLSAAWLSAAQPSPAFLLAWTDWRRLGRRPGTLLALAASAIAPALVTGALTGTARGVASAAVLLFGGMAAASQGCAALRRDTNDATLRRIIGVAPRPSLVARVVLPALLAAGWLALALGLLASAGVLHARDAGSAPAALLWVTLGVVAGPGLAASAMRLARTAPIDATALGGLDTGAGTMPTWLISRIFSVILGLVGIFPLVAAVIAAFGGLHGPGAGSSGASRGLSHGLSAGTIVVQAVLSAALLSLYLLSASPSGGPRDSTGLPGQE